MKRIYFWGLPTFTLITILIAGQLTFQANSANSQKPCSEQQYFSDRRCLTSQSKKLLADNQVKPGKPKIQIAILLDSSNSMDGLIEQARTQIWDLVNALTKVTKNGETPILEVALFHYGNDSLPSSEGFNRLLSSLTTDLDIVSEKLFTIQTNGGQEYAGWVIKSALSQLNWSEDQEDFRVIFIAGNEPFNQGEMDWQKSVNSAKDKDILVNTIYCQNAENEDSRLWAEAAQTGNGSYFNINQNQKTDTLPTPYDQEIFQLNNQLNQTYLPYGSQGQAGQARQQVQDSNLASAVNSQAAVSRAVSKSSDYYRNASWDLVDAVTERTVDLESLETAQLPKPIQGLSLEEKENYIQNMSKERKLIQAKIAELSAKRNNYINEHSSKTGPQNTLNAVMIEALRQQLKTKGFTLQ
jgi:hypothetical protein